MSKTVTLKYGTNTTELPILKGTLGNSVVDIRQFATTGMFTFDPGFLSTASCESKITFIDGEKGLLYYRGYPIEQLAKKSDFLETCYLLIHGELPKSKERKAFVEKITKHTLVHEQLARFFNGFRRDAHPMAMMVGVVGGLAGFYQEELDIKKQEDRRAAQYRLISKLSLIHISEPTRREWLSRMPSSA